MKGDSTGRKLLGDAKVQQIKIFFDNNPKTSLRQGARELNIPFSSVYKTLRKTLRFYPYKIKLIHSMKPEDGPARKLFCGHDASQHSSWPTFSEKVLFQRRSNFPRRWNRKQTQCSYLGNISSKGICRKRTQFTESQRVVRPSPWQGYWAFFFNEPTITQESYLHMLETIAYQELQQLQIQDIIWQQDGAPPHFGLQVRASLDQQFPGRWIGRAGPIPWPARSPDVTPLDFFFWGYVKDCVFRTPVTNIEDLKQRITNTVTLCNPNKLANAWVELRRRLDFLHENDGQSYELFRWVFVVIRIIFYCHQ